MKVLLDTNAVLYFLSDVSIKDVYADFAISFITQIELLSFPRLSKQDSIIASSAYYLNVPLITNDKQLFKINEIDILSYEEFKKKFTRFLEESK